VSPYSRLEGWVYHATFTLARPEGPRQELRQRLMDRTAALEAQGLNLAQAQEQVLQEAGDSSEVRLQLERTCITQEEWQRAEQFISPTPLTWTVLLRLLIFLLVVYIIFFVWSESQSNIGGLLIGLVLSMFIIDYALPKWFHGPTLYKMRWLMQASSPIFALLFFWGLTDSTPRGSLLSGIVIFLITILFQWKSFYQLWRIYPKLKYL